MSAPRPSVSLWDATAIESMWTASPSRRTPFSSALLSVTSVEAPLKAWWVEASTESACTALLSPAAGCTEAAAGPLRMAAARRRKLRLAEATELLVAPAKS